MNVARRCALLLALCAACRGRSSVSEMEKIRVTGTVESLEVRDVSKRAGKENWKSYLALRIESIAPAAAGGSLAEQVRFIGEGELSFSVGERVVVTTIAGDPPLPIYAVERAR